MENKNIETRKLSLRREPVNRPKLIFRSREFPKFKRAFESANVQDNAANSNQTFFFTNSRYEVYEPRVTLRRFFRFAFAHSEKLKIVSFFAVRTLKIKNKNSRNFHPSCDPHMNYEGTFGPK